MNDQISRAAMLASQAACILRDVALEANALNPPEGQSLRDRALAAYLAECLRLARELENKLLLIAD
jgi:hypothetical protein